jgi:hypothetical protein
LPGQGPARRRHQPRPSPGQPEDLRAGVAPRRMPEAAPAAPAGALEPGRPGIRDKTRSARFSRCHGCSRIDPAGCAKPRPVPA